MAKLLIVEDEAAIRQMLLCSLRASGYDCREAENAEQARAQLSAQRPDLALLDIMLPGEDGFSLGRHLRELEVPMLINPPFCERHQWGYETQKCFRSITWFAIL